VLYAHFFVYIALKTVYSIPTKGEYHMTEYREIAQMLRQLLANTQSSEDAIPAGHIMALSEVFDNKADSIEMDMIVEMQRNAV
jgi:hypothetical protein